MQAERATRAGQGAQAPRGGQGRQAGPSAGAYRAYPATQPVQPARAGASRPVQAPSGGGGAAGGDGGRRGGRGRRRGPWRVVFWVALAVFLAALIALGAIFFSYMQGRNANSSVADGAFSVPTDTQAVSLANLTVDWDALRAINPDVIGWVYMPGTMVNYPIVQASDNEKYLKTNFQGETNWLVSFGAIFLDAGNAADFSDANNVIYGHNMQDGAIPGMEGSMFSQIADLGDTATFNANRTVYVLTPDGNYRLTSFALLHTEATDPLVQTSFATAADLQAYVQDKLDRSVVQPDPAAPAAADVSQLFTFSTCDNLPSDGRYVLFCSVAESTVPGAAGTGAAAGADSTAAAAINDAAEEIS